LAKGGAVVAVTVVAVSGCHGGGGGGVARERGSEMDKDQVKGCFYIVYQYDRINPNSSTARAFSECVYAVEVVQNGGCEWRPKFCE